tara:strand:- start:1754 stop:3475 length:1722 start_codon:yes stop_codon:yes gene_type:complete
MKSFKSILSEVAQPKSSEEKAFKDMHTYEVKPHPVAMPHQHTGDIPKADDAARIADQKGDAAYDQAYNPKGAQEPTLRVGRKFSQFRANESVLEENPAEEIPMMKSQLDFICTAATAISKALGNNDPEEWYQNKLATAHEAMKTLHANIIGKNEDVNESKEAADAKALDKASSSSAEGKKKVTLAKAPWDKNEELKGGQKKLDHNKNGKIDGHDFAIMRGRKKSNEEVVAETTSSALKRPVTQTGPDGKTRTVFKKAKADRTDDRGQDVIVGEGLVNELSKKTLGSYIKKAVGDVQKSSGKAGYASGKGVNKSEYDSQTDNAEKRAAGIKKATNKLTGKLKPAANRRPGYVAGDDEIGESNNLVDEAFGDKIKSALSFPKRKISAAHLDNAIKQHDEKRTDHEMKASEAKIIGKSGLSDKQKASYDDSKEMHHRAGEKHHTIAKNHLRAAQTANNKNKMDQVHKHMTDYHKHQDHKTYGKEVHVSKLHKMGTRNEAVNEQVRESFTEMLDEAVKMGNLRLKDGKSVKVSAQDAKLLNQFYKDLNAKNRRDMEKVMMKDTSGFKEIVGFAREAL